MDRYPDLTKFAFGDKWYDSSFFSFFFFLSLFDLGFFSTKKKTDED